MADCHQLLQLLQQHLSNGTDASDASDASCAVSTAPSSSGASSCGRRKRIRRHQDDSDDDKESTTLLPLVQSIQELTACQRQELWSIRNDDRFHEQRMNQQIQLTAMREQYRERILRRKAKLTDEARLYRKLNAELDPKNEQRSRLSAFCVNECRQDEDEICSLELETFNNNT